MALYLPDNGTALYLPKRESRKWSAGGEVLSVFDCVEACRPRHRWNPTDRSLALTPFVSTQAPRTVRRVSSLTCGRPISSTIRGNSSSSVRVPSRAMRKTNPWAGGANYSPRLASS